MPLTCEQKNILHQAIEAYNFPYVYFDFEKNQEVICRSMIQVEEYIRSCLISEDILKVKDGLSNVLFWGYAQIAYGNIRVKKFREDINEGQLLEASSLFKNQNNIDLLKIKKLNMPQFSGMSFISKIAMFLNPERYVVLDKQITKMNNTTFPTLLNNLKLSKNETQIRVSKKNVEVYTNWCLKCIEISKVYFKGSYRAVDIERGFFTLIKNNNIQQAAKILSNA